MKKYFLFDNEPISGSIYFGRFLLGSLLILLGIGIWLIASSVYKRCGSFNWTKESKLLFVFVISISAISNIFNNSADYYNSELNLFDFIALIGGIFHLIILFKNGNKKTIN